MIRSILVAVILLSMPLIAQAQKSSSNPGVDHRVSVSTGIGFASSVGTGTVDTSGFLWQLDGQYRATDNISAGINMQVVPFEIFPFGVKYDATVFTFAFDGRYHFDVLHSQSNDILSKLTPYAGLGMGLWHVGGDLGNFGTVEFNDNAFLFSMIFGIEYDLNEHVALTSDMRFNILGGTAPQIDDHFNYTWQIAGVRYRF